MQTTAPEMSGEGRTPGPPALRPPGIISGVKSAYASLRAAPRGTSPVPPTATPLRRRPAMTTAHASDRFTVLPDEQTLTATVVALEEHGFSVEDVDGFGAPREAGLAR